MQNLVQGTTGVGSTGTHSLFTHFVPLMHNLVQGTTGVGSITLTTHFPNSQTYPDLQLAGAFAYGLSK